MNLCFRILLPLLTALAAAASEVTVLATADLHGRLAELSRLAHCLRGAPDAVKVDAGDFSQGTPVTAALAGRPVMAVFAALGYDLAVPGDMEFDHPPAVFAAWERELPGRIGGAGWEYGPFRPVPLVTVKRQGITVHLLALGPAMLARAAAAVPELRVQPEILTVRRLLSQLPADEGPRAVILVWHTGAADPLALRLLRSCPELDAVIFAHSRRCEPGRAIAGVWAVQPPPFGQGVAELRLRFAPGGKRPAAVLSRILPLPESADAEAAAIAEAACRETEPLRRRQLGSFASPALFAGKAAAVCAEAAGADAALLVLPAEAVLPAELNQLTLAELLPRNNRLVATGLTPAEFRKLAAKAAAGGRQTGVFLDSPERRHDGEQLTAVVPLTLALSLPELREKKFRGTGLCDRDLLGARLP